ALVGYGPLADVRPVDPDARPGGHVDAGPGAEGDRVVPAHEVIGGRLDRVDRAHGVRLPNTPVDLELSAPPDLLRGHQPALWRALQRRCGGVGEIAPAARSRATFPASSRPIQR